VRLLLQAGRSAEAAAALAQLLAAPQATVDMYVARLR
jgi:hypothetical protein